MLNAQSYLRILLSLTSALVTLLGSVGIFVSLIVQRRVERLQDILEEFMDLSYHEDTNLTGKMFRLIEKYQMQYLLPNRPSRMLLKYIDLTIIIVILTWAGVFLLDYRPPFRPVSLIYATPILGGLYVMFLYRHLLKNVVNPVDNTMLSPLIPPPVKLRSVSYLSKYVNVSVKSILKHARLRIVIKEITPGYGKVILKEEISFDNYFYYLQISNSETPIFVAFGELKMEFGHEPVTGKPIPVVKNINIPLGDLNTKDIQVDELTATLLIFSIGEKHPIEYKFLLERQQNIFQINRDPEISINYLITYQANEKILHLLKLETDMPHFLKFKEFYQLNRQRFYWQIDENHDELQPKKFNESFFID